MSELPVINSDIYWNQRFSSDWEACEGPRQSRFFTQLALENLPPWLIEQIRCESLTLVDWGCAQGDGTDVWASLVDPRQLFGVDFSSVAIEQATRRFPSIRFFCENWLEPNTGVIETYDIVFSSNTLEHFHNPYEVLAALSSRARRAVVLVLPYREFARIDEHFHSFLPTNIPLELSNGFNLIWSKVFDCSHLARTLWVGNQIFLVYTAPSWTATLKLTLADCEVAHEDTSSAIHSLNEVLEDRKSQIACLNRSIVDQDGQITNLSQAMAEREEQVARLNLAVDERDGQIASLNQAVDEREGQIASLNLAVDERDRQIAGLNLAVDERDGQIAGLNQAVDERDGQIAGLNRAVDERDGQIAGLNQAVDERDGQIAGLNQAVDERDGQIAGLNQAVDERDRQIAGLNQAVDERDRQIASLNQAVDEHDRQIVGLNQAVDERDRQIAGLNQAVDERDRQIAGLNQAVDERDGQIASLNQAVDERDDQIARMSDDAKSMYLHLTQILNSRSWTVTRPFRSFVRFIRHGHFDEKGNVSVLQLLRSAGRRLPIPFSIKSKLRNALLPKLYPSYSNNSAQLTENNLSSVGSKVLQVPEKYNDMRPELCGLTPGLVSVILPVYNQANLIVESIESVLGQTYQNFELIIINDGSTDGIQNVLKKYSNHPKVKCFNQFNQRLPKALSNGFSFAVGEFWTWTSADNIMESRMLELLVNKLMSDMDLGMVYADYYAIDDRGDLLQDRSWRPHNRPELKSGEIRLPWSTEKLNRIQDNFIGPCFMYRGWIGRIMGDYDPQLGIEDYDYWMRINAFFRIDHLGSDHLLYRYRVHDNTLSANANEHRILEKVQLLMKYEAERAEFYSKPLTVLADAAGLDWINASDAGMVIVGELFTELGELCEETATHADLLILSSDAAKKNIQSLLRLLTPTAIIFNQGDTSYQRLHQLLNRTGCIALVPTKVETARIRLVAKAPVLDINSVQAFLALRAFSKNSQFFNLTRNKEELKRDLPYLKLNPHCKHILLQVDSFTQGGMENVVIDLGLSLKEAGFKVTIGNLGKSGDMVTKSRERGLRIEEFPSSLTEDDYLYWLKQNSVNLVNAHYSIFGARVCHEAGIPFVETIHNSYVWFDPETIQRYSNADRHITLYICVSNSAALYADAVLGLDVTKMKVVRNGVDSRNVNASNFERNRIELREKWKVGPKAPVFLNVASIMATKAQLPLVQAFVQVVKQRPDARLVLLGSVMEKPYHSAVEKAVKTLDLLEHVIFAGYHREVAPFYHAADVFVLPSYWEGWSLSLGEAMANGLACVITDVGSAYEFTGKPRVNVIAPPFGDITQLNYKNLGAYVYGEDHSFNERLGQAMLEILGEVFVSERVVDLSVAKEMSSSIAYKKYSEIFLSILNIKQCNHSDVFNHRTT